MSIIIIIIIINSLINSKQFTPAQFAQCDFERMRFVFCSHVLCCLIIIESVDSISRDEARFSIDAIYYKRANISRWVNYHAF